VPVELIILEFGKPVADIVMGPPKARTKAQAIQTALKKSREAKLIKTKKSDSQIQCPLLGDERTRRGHRGTDAIDP
jgi:antitoxin (DNA-binding transcriptional repressor) of toxin-antitoxin stability system